MSETRVSGVYVAAGDPLIGAVLGSYRITSVIAVGGMGRVYRAQHELLDRPAAIKLLHAELTGNDELVQRFFNEAKAATAIRHPGIVEVYDFGYTEDGHAYLVMEALEGVTLGGRLEQCARLAEADAAWIARGIASALKAAHGKGIVHRDLKPDNVFLVPDPDGGRERIKVLDFGVAKLLNPSLTGESRTRAGVLMGTPLYMAPEQAREAGTTDHRADLYSLGCILYEMLVGAPPFDAGGVGEIIAMQLFTEAEPPSARGITVSPELEHLVMQLLAKEPQARPPTAQAVMDIVSAFCSAPGRPSAPMSARLSASAMASSSTQLASVGAASHHSVQPRSQPQSQPRIVIERLDTLPATAVQPAVVQRSRRPLVIGGLVLATAGVAALAFVLASRAREPDGPARPPSTIAAPTAVVPAPAPITPTPVVTPATPAPIDVPVVIDDPADRAAKQPKRPPVRPVDKPGKPTTATVVPATPAPVEPPKPGPTTGLPTTALPTTDRGSPIEESLDDPKKAP
ncbi:MAG: protein kinase [Deltaproteobacteria bacterium]|nr:protein kinase [Deltaproteobacteria bacterium]MDQ3296531.1 protein kinase [Myxococcota bacterium]